MDLKLHTRMSQLIEGELRASPYGSREELARYLFVEHPTFIDEDAPMVAKRTGLDVRVIRALSHDPQWRQIVSRIISLSVVDYAQEKANITAINELVTTAKRPSDRIRAYMAVAQQTGTKLPERTEVENTHRLEIVTRRLETKESGYVPRTPYQKPVSKRDIVRELSRAEAKGLPQASGVEGQESVGSGDGGVEGVPGSGEASPEGGDAKTITVPNLALKARDYDPMDVGGLDAD